MSFTYEEEQNNCLPFLDVMVTREDDRLSTSLYRKPTFSGLYTNFFSYISEKYKKGLLFSILFRIFTFTVDWNKFHTEVEFLKGIFRKNSYPDHFIDKCIRLFLDKRLTVVQLEKQKHDLKISLPFMGKYSNELKKRISRSASKFLGSNKISITWNSPRKLRNLFTFKDKLPMLFRTNILYRFTCNGCNSIYIGKTKRHFLVRAYEHLGLSLRTGNAFTYNPNNTNNTGILDHVHQAIGCNGKLENFEIIGGAKNDFCLRIKESILIQKYKPTINSTSISIPLLLFKARY